jgi:hypothetical protein
LQMIKVEMDPVHGTPKVLIIGTYQFLIGIVLKNPFRWLPTHDGAFHDSRDSTREARRR